MRNWNGRLIIGLLAAALLALAGCDDGGGGNGPFPNDVQSDNGGDVEQDVPADPCAGLECGTGTDGTTDCGSCGSTEGCNANGQCVATEGPCQGLECGLGTDGTTACGECTGGRVCDENVCVQPSDPCDGFECGLGTDGTTACGTCSGDEICEDNQCVQPPDPCAGLECGTGTDGTTDCGSCGSTEECNANGQCVATEGPCQGFECGLGTDGTTNCGDCSGGLTCEDNTCVAVADPCEGRECGTGTDGTTSCGSCAGEEVCTSQGQCEAEGDPCAGLECGTGTDGETDCGTCAAGEECSVDGQCLVPANALGEFCGVTADCAATIPDPSNPAEEIDNPDFPDCMHQQCTSGFCLQAGASGVFSLYPVCSQPCQIYKDEVNNATGADGADGIEDLDAPLSDCSEFSDGPGGTDYVCANFGQPGQQESAFCVPGTGVQECSANSDCPEGEGCQLTTIGGQINERCMTRIQPGEWGDTAGVGGMCNEDPFSGDVTLCEAGLCFGVGCATYCSEDADCDTTQVFEGTGCDTEAGHCLGWEDQACETDLDCSAWICNPEPMAPFGADVPYEANFCWPKSCDTNPDCAPGTYCRFFWNGQGGAEAGWDNMCLAENPDGVAIGEACDPDPEDNIPGDTCAAEDLCVGGYCSAICETDADCAADKDQLCTAVEFTVDANEDGDPDAALPLTWCSTLPDFTTDCLADAECAEGETCFTYEVENLLDQGDGTFAPDPDAPFTMSGKCVPADEEKGAFGDLCGVPGADFQECQSGFCLGAEPDANQAGYCAIPCTTQSDCPATLEADGSTFTTRCSSLLLGWGGEFDNPATNVYVPMCQLNPPASSTDDCATDFTCAEETEACLPYIVNFGPDYPAAVEFICQDMANADETYPDKQLGEACDPNAEDAEGNPVEECASGFCLEDEGEGTGYCSALCSDAVDSCGDAGLVCDTFQTFRQEKQGAYVDFEPVYSVCQKDTDCIPCSTSGTCPGDRVCVNLGADADTLSNYRCVPACETAAECEGETATACNEGLDAFDRPVQGCFELDGETPVDYCAPAE
ncbi:MAG: hypothetical protein ACQEXJ_12660 [Myxococcota bacterium]